MTAAQLITALQKADPNQTVHCNDGNPICWVYLNDGVLFADDDPDEPRHVTILGTIERSDDS